RPPTLLRDPAQYLFRAAWRLVNHANRETRNQQAHVRSCETAELITLADQFHSQWVVEEAEAAWAEDEFERVLGELPPACRAVLLLQCRDGYSYKEISQKLGISVHMVKVYASRAQNHFRRHYNACESGHRENRP